jgi:UDP:flavonoid glycosyltransferase YjiC (YdhE family)
MARILAYTSPARGHLYPLVPILDELAGRGHEIAIRTLASQVALMGGHGFAAAPISSRVEGIVHDDYLARTPQGSLKRGVATFAARAEYEVSDLPAAIDAERPDVLLVDAMSWGASSAAAAWDGPWAQWFPYPLPMPSPDVPPFGPGLRPASGSLGRLRDRALRPLMLSSMEKVFLPSVNAARRASPNRPSGRSLRCSPPLRCCST